MTLECQTPTVARYLGSLLPIFPRHRPRASTEGRAREKINKTGVRLWTPLPLDRNWQIGDSSCQRLPNFQTVVD